MRQALLGLDLVTNKTRNLEFLEEMDRVVRLEKLKAGIRAKVEHPFRVIKRQFGYTTARYRGLAKNAAQATTLFMLSNLWMVRRKWSEPAA